MSLYKKGLCAPAIGIGSWSDPYRERVSMGAEGFRLINHASKHFYKRGITGKTESAFQKRATLVGGVMDSATSFIMDVVHLMLLLGGAYMVVNVMFG